MKHVDVKDNTYMDFRKEVNDKDPKFKVVDHVRITKYKNIFAKVYMPNWSEEVFVVSKMKNTVPRTYVINELNGEEIIGTFYEKGLQKTNQKELRIEKVIKRKRDKLYVNWKGYDNLFNSWIDTVPQTCVINDLNDEEIIRTFYEKELQNTNQKEFRIEKGIRRTIDKLYVKWKGYDNSFNSWIDKKDLV